MVPVKPCQRHDRVFNDNSNFIFTGKDKGTASALSLAPQEAFQFLRAKCHSRTSAAGRSWQRTARKNQFHLREPLQQPFAPLACNTFLNESDVPPIVPISNLRPRSLRNRGRRSVACPMILHTASTHIH